MKYDRLWERLIEYLNEWASARQMPGGIEVTFERSPGVTRNVEVVVTSADWDDYVRIIYGTGDPRANTLEEAPGNDDGAREPLRAPARRTDNTAQGGGSPMLLRTLTTGILLVGLGGCSSIDAGGPVNLTTSEMAASADAHVDLPVGATAPIRVHAHCGFEFTQIDGKLWRTRLRDDGQGNPPVGWPQMVVGTINRTSEREATFIGENVRVHAVFHPAPHAQYMCA